MKCYKGSAYIMVLMLVLVSTVLAFGISSVTMADYNIAKTDDGSNDAYYIADGGATAMSYEFKMQVKEIYEEITRQAESQDTLPIDQYIEQYFYEEIPESYNKRIDFADGEARYSDVTLSFSSSDKMVTIRSQGHVKDAISTVEIKGKVVPEVCLEIDEWREIR